MAAAVKIDFSNTYEIQVISTDLRNSSFNTILEDGSSTLLMVEISSESHELLPDVYNLAFGPLNKRGRINDKAELTHKDYSKVFSTILLEAFNYLDENRNHFLGIDGSDNARAYLYYRFILKNLDYLNSYFNIYGIKYYVRISRFGKTQYENPFDFSDILLQPDLIEMGKPVSSDHLYNYFIFNYK